MGRADKGPRISVNKLGEYIVSRAARQTRIIRNQKYPSDYITAYYKDAQESISQFLSSNLENYRVLETKIQLLDQTVPENVYQSRRIQGNIEAIENFATLIDDIDFHGAIPKLGKSSGATIPIQNVEVSVRPEVILEGTNSAGAKIVGGIKLHFPKTQPLNNESSGYISAVTQMYCDARLADLGDSDHRLSIVVDVASGKVFPGVKAITQRKSDVEAACQQIFSLWPTIKP